MTMDGFSVVPWNLSCAITISGIHHNCDSITSIFGNNCLILRIRIFDGCLFVKPMKVCVCSDKKKNTRSTTYVATILNTCTVNNAARQNFGLYMFQWLQVHCVWQVASAVCFLLSAAAFLFLARQSVWTVLTVSTLRPAPGISLLSTFMQPIRNVFRCKQYYSLFDNVPMTGLVI